jgi:hypothetical protein
MLRSIRSTAFSSLVSSLTALFLSVSAAVGAGQVVGPTVKGSASSPKSSELPKDIDQVLWWLPEDTESVVISRGNVPLRRLKAFQASTEKEARPAWVSPPEYLYPTHDYDYQD